MIKIDAKKYLRQIRTIDDEINSLQRQRETTLASLIGAVNIKQDVVSGGKSDTELTYIKIVELGNKINRKIDELTDLKNETSMLIECLEEPRHRIILRDYYLSGNTWEEVAEHNNYSLRAVHKIHGQALIEFNSQLKKRVH